MMKKERERERESKKETIICLGIYEHSNFLNGKNLFLFKNLLAIFLYFSYKFNYIK